MVDFTQNPLATENVELLKNAKAGCANAINMILIRSRDHVFSVVRGYLGRWQNTIDPDDVVQTIQFSVYQDLPKCRAITWNEFRHYLMTVSRNKALHAIEKQKTQKRGGRVQISHLSDRAGRVAGQPCDVSESQDLDDLVAKLETITSLHPDHAAVLRSYVSSADAPKRCQIDSLALQTGKPRQHCYAAVKRFQRDARAIVQRRYDSDLVAAVKDDLRTGQCRRSMRNCYGLSQSDLDAIEVS